MGFIVFLLLQIKNLVRFLKYGSLVITFLVICTLLGFIYHYF